MKLKIPKGWKKLAPSAKMQRGDKYVTLSVTGDGTPVEAFWTTVYGLAGRTQKHWGVLCIRKIKKK